METSYTPFTPKKTAILVDLSFFLKMYQKNQGNFSAQELVKRLKDYLFKTLTIYGDTIHRFYIYDCEPLSTGRVVTPISKTTYELKNTQAYKFRKEVLDELKRQPLFAVRLGKISGKIEWKLKTNILNQLLKGYRDFSSLTDNDFVLDIKQKGVDMKIGLDMASLSLKKQVEKIILITGDSDFVPAIKMVRREGIIVQLDPLRYDHPSADLLDHIDLLYSILPHRN